MEVIETEIRFLIQSDGRRLSAGFHSRTNYLMCLDVKKYQRAVCFKWMLKRGSGCSWFLFIWGASAHIYRISLFFGLYFCANFSKLFMTLWNLLVRVCVIKSVPEEKLIPHVWSHRAKAFADTGAVTTGFNFTLHVMRLKQTNPGTDGLGVLEHSRNRAPFSTWQSSQSYARHHTE